MSSGSSYSIVGFLSCSIGYLLWAGLEGLLPLQTCRVELEAAKPPPTLAIKDLQSILSAIMSTGMIAQEPEADLPRLAPHHLRRNMCRRITHQRQPACVDACRAPRLWYIQRRRDDQRQ